MSKLGLFLTLALVSLSSLERAETPTTFNQLDLRCDCDGTTCGHI